MRPASDAHVPLERYLLAGAGLRTEKPGYRRSKTPPASQRVVMPGDERRPLGSSLLWAPSGEDLRTGYVRAGERNAGSEPVDRTPVGGDLGAVAPESPRLGPEAVACIRVRLVADLDTEQPGAEDRPCGRRLEGRRPRVVVGQSDRQQNLPAARLGESAKAPEVFRVDRRPSPRRRGVACFRPPRAAVGADATEPYYAGASERRSLVRSPRPA